MILPFCPYCGKELVHCAQFPTKPGHFICSNLSCEFFRRTNTQYRLPDLEILVKVDGYRVNVRRLALDLARWLGDERPREWMEQEEFEAVLGRFREG